MAIAGQVLEVCRTVFEDPTVTLESTTRSVPRWDSLAHMNLIAALETHFGVELDVMAMAEVDGVRALVTVVEGALRGTADPLRSSS